MKKDIFLFFIVIFIINYYHNQLNKNYLKEFKIDKILAKQGNSKKQFRLGWLYYNGYGVKKDLNKAIYWFKISAKQGNIQAKNELRILNKHKNNT
jgi:TPR repeat protein